MRQLAFSIAALAAAAAGGCASGGGDSASTAAPPEPVPLWETYDANRGELLFRSICGGYCHGISEGKRDAPFLFDCNWQHGGSDREIFAVIANGVPSTRMIGFGGKLPEGDTDIWNVLAFIRKTTPCE